VVLAEGAREVTANAELETVALPTALGALTFGVGAQGLAIADATGPLLTLPSLNGDLSLAFADGTATLRQTGAETYELTGAGPDDVAVIGTDDGPVTIDLVV
jgi:hypothetical protein